MGKKGGGSNVNTKVEAANAKKAAAQAVKNAKASAAAEAAEAADWSKGSDARGDRRRQEEERKRQEAEAKKAELKRIQALEEHALEKMEDKSAIRKNTTKAKKEVNKPWEEALKPAVKKSNRGARAAPAAASTAPVPHNGKVTQAMIAAKKEAEAAKAAKEAADRAKGITFGNSFTENRNRSIDVEGEARSLEAALDVLTTDDTAQKHPEKRMKAAYKAFEEAMMPQFRADFPGLKLSQYKDRIFEAWKKSPENPMNQASLAYNAKK
ncbi:hypothetical protein Poli38472_008141 [Pythium oligandrum]|uniref:Coiled-coil domain-containing protein 124 n=1 Tax=Pythium oligandrum TaxID=41045 RepID=A0A8K1CL29_PYTOL|nr:hypothetical protein Poli38472_008141 [Pythium oligandrum]|eukprot:TMW65499.1 hypothetical protein Poli38472_008141 [Pythium oligandrum]